MLFPLSKIPNLSSKSGVTTLALGLLWSGATGPLTAAPSQAAEAAQSEVKAAEIGAAGVNSQLNATPVLSLASRTFLKEHCLDCHDSSTTKAGLDLEKLLTGDLLTERATWEKAWRKMATRQMPPPKAKDRPAEADLAAAVLELRAPLDALPATPARTETVRRLTRFEYGNAVRDLLDVQVPVEELLPADESSHGFDNVTVGTLSPLLLDRFLTAAQKVSRLHLGITGRRPAGQTWRMPPDATQEARAAGLPFGTRGGMVVEHTFPTSGEYEVQLRLTRDRNDMVEGLRGKHTVLVLLDDTEVGRFTVKPVGEDEDQSTIDAHLVGRFPVSAGQHRLGITFLPRSTSLLEYERQPYEAQFNFHRHPRSNPALYQISLTGPLATAQTIPARPLGALRPLLRRAWRREITEADVARFEKIRQETKSDEATLSALLVSREFLFRVELPPPGTPPGTVYSLSPHQLATRLAFFLWSSLPDDILLDLAASGKLREPEVLQMQARRLLQDARARSLTTSFASQWLQLRNLQGTTPDGRLFPDFDDNLRQAMRQETELAFQEMVQRDGSLLDLLNPSQVWLNERLARHYGVPGVAGAEFRPVQRASTQGRGGLLRQGSILTLTSYADRTSPVLRGKWVLETLLGTPPAPPAPDVPGLDNGTVSEKLPVRQRLAAHRDKPACAGCHAFIDPPGFAWEEYDAVGRLRLLEGEHPVDSTGGLPDGTACHGVGDMEKGLLARPELLATTFTEKLLIYALGRGLAPEDAPTVRAVVDKAAKNKYAFSSFIAGLVSSPAFCQRLSLAD